MYPSPELTHSQHAGRSIVLARAHDDDAFGRLDVAHEGVLVLAPVAVLALDVALDCRVDLGDDHIGRRGLEGGFAVPLELRERACWIGVLDPCPRDDTRDSDAAK